MLLRVLKQLKGRKVKGLGRHYSLKNYQWLLASPRVERWLRFKTSGTKRSQLMKLEKFLSWTGRELGIKDPDSFLAWSKSRPDSIEVEDAVEKFAETQSSASRPMMVSVPRSFLKRNGYSNLPSTTMPRIAKVFHEGFKRRGESDFILCTWEVLRHPRCPPRASRDRRLIESKNLTTGFCQRIKPFRPSDRQLWR